MLAVVQIWPCGPELKLEGRCARDDTCNRQFGTGSVGSNTTRSRLVALRSVPFTRIPGQLAHGRANEVLPDSWCSLTVVQGYC